MRMTKEVDISVTMSPLDLSPCTEKPTRLPTGENLGHIFSGLNLAVFGSVTLNLTETCF